jgi:hypothetical protein
MVSMQAGLDVSFEGRGLLRAQSSKASLLNQTSRRLRDDGTRSMNNWACRPNMPARQTRRRKAEREREGKKGGGVESRIHERNQEKVQAMSSSTSCSVAE